MSRSNSCRAAGAWCRKDTPLVRVFRLLPSPLDLADLAFDVVGADVIRLLAEEQILVVGQPKCEPTLVPHSVELALALLNSGLQNGFGNEVVFEPKERLTNTFDNPLVIGFPHLDPLGIDFAIARRHAVVSCALENGQLFGLLRNLRNGLNGRRA